MNKKPALILGIALVFLLGIALATTISASSEAEIYAFDQKPTGSNEGNEWVTLHNPSNESVDIGNWTFESTPGTTAIEWIPEGTTLYPGAYYTYTPFYRWLDNSEEAIIYGIQRVRLVGINRPEIGEVGYEASTSVFSFLILLLGIIIDLVFMVFLRIFRTVKNKGGKSVFIRNQFFDSV